MFAGLRTRLMLAFSLLLLVCLAILTITFPGGRVTLTTQGGKGDTVLVSVTDTGHGIPAQELPRVFERFYQVDKSRTRTPADREAGEGLGLAIVSEIVRAHGGHVGVESIVGSGTRFTVTLPAGQKGSDRT